MTARTDHPSAHRCAHGQRIGAPCVHCDTEARLKHEAQHLRRALIYAADLIGCNLDDLTDAVCEADPIPESTQEQTP